MSTLAAVCRVALGVIFLGAAATKLRSRSATAEAIDSFGFSHLAALGAVLVPLAEIATTV